MKFIFYGLLVFLVVAILTSILIVSFIPVSKPKRNPDPDHDTNPYPDPDDDIDDDDDDTIPEQPPIIPEDCKVVPDATCQGALVWMQNNWKTKSPTFDEFKNNGTTPSTDMMQQYLYTCESKKCPCVANYSGPSIACPPEPEPSPPSSPDCDVPITSTCTDPLNWMKNNWRTKSPTFDSFKNNDTTPPTDMLQQYLYVCESKKCPCVKGYSGPSITCPSEPAPSPSPSPSPAFKCQVDKRIPVPAPPTSNASSLVIATANFFWWALWKRDGGKSSSYDFFSQGPFDLVGMQEVGEGEGEEPGAVKALLQCSKYQDETDGQAWYSYVKTKGTPMLFKSSRFTLINSKTVVVSSDNSNPGYGDRYLSMMRLHDKILGRDVIMANAHGALNVDTGGKAGLPGYVNNIRAALTDFGGSDITILVGDFNLNLRFMEAPMKAPGEGLNTPFTFAASTNGKGGLELDHIWYRSPIPMKVVNPLNWAIGSDHWALKVTLEPQ